MYFQILPIQKDKYTDMGMLNISANLYLEEGDEGYDKYIAEHRIQIPIIPKEGYPRQKELDGEVEAQNAYREQQQLISTFPEEIRVIDGEEVICPILPEGFIVLENPVDKERELYSAWIASLPKEEQLTPFCNHSIQFEHDVTEEEILWCFEFALAITHRNYLIDDLHCKRGGQVVNQLFGYSKRRMEYQTLDANKISKVTAAENKFNSIKDIDFTNITTIGKYSVRK